MSIKPSPIIITSEQIQETAKDLLFNLTQSSDYSPENGMPESAALRQAEILVERWLRHIIFEDFLKSDIDYWMFGIGSKTLHGNVRLAFEVWDMEECDVEGCRNKPIKGEIVCTSHFAQ